MNNQHTITALKNAAGSKQVLTTSTDTLHYRQGFRSGGGDAIAVVFPTDLLTLWRVLQICVQSDVIVIMQAANTGLTEGSTPSGNDYDRPVVIIQTLKLNQFLLIDDARQVVSFPGTTLFQLEDALKPFGREPHSVIGSSCIGASVIGGIANNSGGSLIKRGPAYTELSLYAQVNSEGELQLVNHLGIDLGDDPEQILQNLQRQNFSAAAVKQLDKLASDKDYEQRVRDVDADTPARFNADQRRLYEASGCAGKLAIFAVRSDTFQQPRQTKTFYLGVSDPALLTKLRRDILQDFHNLPVSAEYVHKIAFDIAHKYGKDSFLAIDKLGTANMPRLFALKNKVAAFLDRQKWLPDDIPDKILFYCCRLMPEHLPKSLLKMRADYPHHLIIKMADAGIEELRTYLQKGLFAGDSSARSIECSEAEAKKAMLQRFVVAGAAIRYEQLHKNKVEDILALDVALKRNEQNWVENLPAEIASEILHPLYYGHFFCHVFHRDYILKKGFQSAKIKAKLLKLLEQQGAKYPAEHNVGHLYQAPESQQQFYQQLDPSNTFNAGVGKMSKQKQYGCGC
ncbi:MAG: D-lactate dehydrogenase [Pseudomonadales bacterium]|nr:D-lactate dehydrogenase [Pseudomonadales bacterium]NRA14806.1 D-lactate dehydrogenase [Oceanospirillaceae bacterium]